LVEVVGAGATEVALTVVELGATEVALTVLVERAAMLDVVLIVVAATVALRLLGTVSLVSLAPEQRRTTISDLE